MFLAFGEIMARLAPADHLRWRQAVPGRIEVTWGGGEANVAVSLANFGLNSAFATVLPKNEIGNACVAELRRFGVDTAPIVRGSGRMGISLPIDT